MTGLSRAMVAIRFRRRRWLNTRRSNQLISTLGSAGPDSEFTGSATVLGPAGIHLGSNVTIGDGAFIRGEGGLRIGDNTRISRNLVLYTTNHDYEGELLPYDKRQIKRPVEIGRNVWIGMNVCIAPGTRIGDGAIIGMGSVVAGEVPPLAIVGSPKWRLLGQRDEAHYTDLDSAGKYSGRGGRAMDDD